MKDLTKEKAAAIVISNKIVHLKKNLRNKVKAQD